jgi:hypothetical protein
MRAIASLACAGPEAFSKSDQAVGRQLPAAVTVTMIASERASQNRDNRQICASTESSCFGLRQREDSVSW